MNVVKELKEGKITKEEALEKIRLWKFRAPMLQFPEIIKQEELIKEFRKDQKLLYSDEKLKEKVKSGEWTKDDAYIVIEGWKTLPSPYMSKLERLMQWLGRYRPKKKVEAKEKVKRRPKKKK